MPKIKQPGFGSKKISPWFKPWAKEKKPPEKAPEPVPEPAPDHAPLKNMKSSPPTVPTKKSLVNNPLTGKTVRSPNIQNTTPAKMDQTSQASTVLKKPRSLGKPEPKQIANQPINIPIKQSIHLMKDVINKVKGSSTVPLSNEPKLQPNNLAAPPSWTKIEPAETSQPTVLSQPTELTPPAELPSPPENSEPESLPLEPENIRSKSLPPEPENSEPEILPLEPEISGSEILAIELENFEPESLPLISDPCEPSLPPEESLQISQSVPIQKNPTTTLKISNPQSTQTDPPPISDTLSEIRHIKIWSLKSESIDPTGKSTEELFSEAIALYRLGLSGEKEAVPQAFKLLISVLQNDRRNVLAEAYLGSVIALMGRDAQDPNDRFKLAIKGLKILDKVVSLEPDHIEIRGLRAFACAKLPEQYFHRSDTAIEDFTYLASRYEEDESLFPKDFYYQILFELALAYNHLGKAEEAESTCRKLLSLTTDAKYRTLIKQEGLLSSDLPRWQQRQLNRKTEPKNDWKKPKNEEALQEGISLHSRALAGDFWAAERAYEIFKQAHKRNPQDPLIKAYYADCLSLMGQGSSDTSTLFRHATHAVKTLDEAVNASPDNITIRLLRGNNSYRIPEAFFRRTLTAIHDFEYLVKRYEEDPSILPEETYWKILYDLGDAYERLEMTEDAKATWRKLLACGDTPYQEVVDELLKGDSKDPSTLAEDRSAEELLQEGIRLHSLAANGNKKAAAKAYEILQKAYQADITNPLSQGYFGSSMAILGHTSNDPTKMYQNFFKGMGHIRKAIANDPNNYTLHFLLAQLMYRYSPTFFQGSEKAIKEFKFLKIAYEKDQHVFSEEDYLQILYDLGGCYQRIGDSVKAHKCWERLSKLTTDPKYIKRVEQDQEGEVDMDKERIRNKFKEIAEDIAQERAKERGERKERRRSKKHASENSVEKVDEKPRRKRKKRKKEKGTLALTETTWRKRKKDRQKSNP